MMYRSLFMSDFHLGSHNCQGDRLFRFLCTHTAETLYLVGDVIEMNMVMSTWPASHVNCLKEIFRLAISGTRIVYIPGNHDRLFRNHLGDYGNLSVKRETVHADIDGNPIMVVHGDQNDQFKSRLSLKVALGLDILFGSSFWELSRKYFGPLIKRHTASFETGMVDLAKDLGFVGIICGHVHMPNIATVDGVRYMNCGDWTHHCTAIAEDVFGNFTLLQG
jgi:UDP-2,3-diacylglucosamine pyrophosphatase LpxH